VPYPPTYTAIRLTVKRHGLDMDMNLCRKIFASHLIKSGLDSNTVDMLQGRCPQLILVRHYQTPDSQLRDRVLDALEELIKQIK
jgi:intergrase/recombinase